MNDRERPIASLSLDLDNEWSYMQTAGNEEWQDYPTYLPAVVPRIIEFFERHDASITFFVVGKDAEIPRNHAALQLIADRSHEFGNHSFGHQPWLHCYSKEELTNELAMAEDAIATFAGRRPDLFRGPGYSYSEEVLEVLDGRSYRADCTSFPNSTAALSRLYLFSKSTIGTEDKEKRGEVFGKNSEMFRPLKPYRWKIGSGRLFEVPVSTMPLFRVPFHFSYILYIAQFSRFFALSYFRSSLLLCRATGTEPSLLFHPLDFMGADDDRQVLDFFPGMRLSSATKIEVLDKCMGMIRRYFRTATIGEHLDAIEARGAVPTRAY